MHILVCLKMIRALRAQRAMCLSPYRPTDYCTCEPRETSSIKTNQRVVVSLTWPTTLKHSLSTHMLGIVLITTQEAQDNHMLPR